MPAVDHCTGTGQVAGTQLQNDVQFKEILAEAGFAKGGQPVILASATLAGFVASACSLPFDFVKTRLQKMDKLPDGTYPYKGFTDCFAKTLTQEGPLKFYTGFPTYCVRYACSRGCKLVRHRTIGLAHLKHRSGARRAGTDVPYNI